MSRPFPGGMGSVKEPRGKEIPASEVYNWALPGAWLYAYIAPSGSISTVPALAVLSGV